MSKLILWVFLSISVLIFGNEMQEKLERDLEIKYGTFDDGQSVLKIKYYDIEFEKDKIKVELEIKGKEGAQTFKEINRVKFDALAKEIAEYIQMETKEKQPVEITVKTNEDFFEAKYPYKKIFQ